MHARFFPRRHRFAYRAFYVAVDLDELPLLARCFRLLSVNSPNLFSINDRDFLPVAEVVHNRTGGKAITLDATAPLRARVEACLSAYGLSVANGRVELVAMPRMFGYLFNPISFFFCYAANGQPIATIVEVTNTFREIKVFVLGPDTFDDGAFRLRVSKDFYVSPFSDVDLAFDFTLRPADQDVAIRIDDYDGDLRTFTSSLAGRARPLSDARLAWYLFAYPLMTARVMALIHWNAFLLLLKRTRWYAKAARAHGQRDLRRPHTSLTNARTPRPSAHVANPI